MNRLLNIVPTISCITKQIETRCSLKQKEICFSWSCEHNAISCTVKIILFANYLLFINSCFAHSFNPGIKFRCLAKKVKAENLGRHLAQKLTGFSLSHFCSLFAFHPQFGTAHTDCSSPAKGCWPPASFGKENPKLSVQPLEFKPRWIMSLCHLSFCMKLQRENQLLLKLSTDKECSLEFYWDQLLCLSSWHLWIVAGGGHCFSSQIPTLHTKCLLGCYHRAHGGHGPASIACIVWGEWTYWTTLWLCGEWEL